MEDHEKWEAEANGHLEQIAKKLDPCFHPNRKPKWKLLGFSGNRAVLQVTVEAYLGDKQPLFDGKRMKEILNAEFDQSSSEQLSKISGQCCGVTCDIEIVSQSTA